jgi:hypothetical protein
MTATGHASVGHDDVRANAAPVLATPGSSPDSTGDLNTDPRPTSIRWHGPPRRPVGPPACSNPGPAARPAAGARQRDASGREGSGLARAHGGFPCYASLGEITGTISDRRLHSRWPLLPRRGGWDPGHASAGSTAAGQTVARAATVPPVLAAARNQQAGRAAFCGTPTLRRPGWHRIRAAARLRRGYPVLPALPSLARWHSGPVLTRSLMRKVRTSRPASSGSSILVLATPERCSATSPCMGATLGSRGELPVQTLVSCATFSSSVIRAQQILDPFGGRPKPVVPGRRVRCADAITATRS